MLCITLLQRHYELAQKVCTLVSPQPDAGESPYTRSVATECRAEAEFNII